MSRILVTGMSGTGKSSALAELGRRGYRIVDTDDPGWREYREDVESSDEVRRGEWLWVEDRIAGLLDSDDDRSLFVQGCVRNQSKFYDRFDAVVLLSAPADVILDRIARRTTNSYGKTAVERAMILDDLARVEPLLRGSCTHELDAGRPLDEVVGDLIAIARRGSDTASWEQLHLDTDRLRLRTPTLQDADALHDLFADPEVMRGLGKEPVSALEETRALIEGGLRGWRTDGLGPFILETAANDRQALGLAGLMIFDTRGWTPSTWADAGSHAQPELGWALIRAYWGHGYATEAAAAIRDWARDSRSIDRLVSLIAPDNVRSQRVARRVGAVPTETVTPAQTKRKTVVWRHPGARV